MSKDLNKKALVLGGNRFFGKKLTKLLIENNYDVTLLNRGNIDDGFGDQITRIKCDRSDIKEFSKHVQKNHWHYVFDQICFDYDTAKLSCELFNNNVDRYIFTSTQSVYSSGEDLKEDDFNVHDYKMTKKCSMNENYGEAKRQAELAFKEHATFPVVSVRFPIVIGEDDYTKRFSFHIERIADQKQIYFPNAEAKLSFINSDDAAKSLLFLVESDFTGPVNVASPSPIRLLDFVATLERSIKKNALISNSATEENHSPYGVNESWFANCDKLSKLGLTLPEIKDWLPEKIDLLI